MKLNKKRLQELAAINNSFGEAKQEEIKESNVRYAQGILEMTVDFESFLTRWEAACEANGVTSAVDLEAKDQAVNSLMETVRENLVTWLGNNGLEWLQEGIESGDYDEFINK
jgi:hypothetical protein